MLFNQSIFDKKVVIGLKFLLIIEKVKIPSIENHKLPNPLLLYTFYSINVADFKGIFQELVLFMMQHFLCLLF